MTAQRSKKRVRYAVVGLGHIAQVAVLPAFKNAPNAQLAALVSGDAVKLRLLGRKYGVTQLVRYQAYDALLSSGLIDAVFLCLPNHLHRDYSLRASKAGIHVLCEKPLAVTVEDCQKMIAAAAKHKTLLMTAYRLHFDVATLKALAEVRKGFVGTPALLQASLNHQVKVGNVRRLPRRIGGGPLYDLGVYCINAARTFFGTEPFEVSAYMHSVPLDARTKVETSIVAVMRFPKGQLAMFRSSNDTEDANELGLVGPHGKLHIEKAFEYKTSRKIILTKGERKRTITIPRHDQFAAQLIHFSHCIQQGRQPQPDGWEGLADVRVIQALHLSAKTGRAVALGPFKVPQRPDPRNAMALPPVGKMRVIRASAPSAG